jgi:4-phosphopantoate--beta-alanine ligase
VISVNGNTAVLCSGELVELADSVDAKLEINLFYRTHERVKAIEGILRKKGAKEVLGIEPGAQIMGTESERRKVDSEGIYKADVVLVALEDGDRTKALMESKKKVIAVDLNPLSRTARSATITIVDNVVRAVPLLLEAVDKLKSLDDEKLEGIILTFDNARNLNDSLSEIIEGLKNQGFH